MARVEVGVGFRGPRTLHREGIQAGKLELKWVQAVRSWGSLCREHPSRTTDTKVDAAEVSQGAWCRGCPDRAAIAEVCMGQGFPGLSL